VRDRIEQDVAQLLSSVQLPDDWERQILRHVDALSGQPDDLDQQRSRIDAQLKRAERLFYLGDWNEEKYLAERAELQAQLARLRPVNAPDLVEAGALLRDFPSLYAHSSPEKQKGLFRGMLERVFVEGDEVCAIQPRDKLFQVMYTYSCGPDGIRTRDLGLDRAAC
jgi:hypothetical protein